MYTLFEKGRKGCRACRQGCAARTSNVERRTSNVDANVERRTSNRECKAVQGRGGGQAATWAWAECPSGAHIGQTPFAICVYIVYIYNNITLGNKGWKKGVGRERERSCVQRQTYCKIIGIHVCAMCSVCTTYVTYYVCLRTQLGSAFLQLESW